MGMGTKVGFSPKLRILGIRLEFFDVPKLALLFCFQCVAFFACVYLGLKYYG